MPSERINFLVERYFSNNCTEEEKYELMQWANTASESELEKILYQSWTSHESNLEMPEEMSQRILASIFSVNEYQEEEYSLPEEVSPIFWRTSYGIAATIALIISAGLFIWFQYNTVDQRIENRIVQVKEFEKNDILPGSEKAILTFDDGSKIVLDNSKNGTLGKQGETNILKPEKGQLVYQATQGTVTQPMYNTVTTPKGGQYQIVLSDGTKVWLNAASSLRFPLVFSGNERKVEMTGEVYFEVAKNAKKPFKVITDGQEVEVLGTHFNIMAYHNEKAIKTTLLEGSVKVSRKERSTILQPGQQAKVGFNNNIFRTLNDVSLEEELAWKNGYFEFNNASLELIMRQIERWYDVEIQYIGKIPDEHFTGKLQRNTNLSNVLKILSMSEVQFKIEGKKIIITP
jgi:transmembrane sensor